jgi:hypothetical protein
MDTQAEFDTAVRARMAVKGESLDVAARVLAESTNPGTELTIEFSTDDGTEYVWSSYNAHTFFPSADVLDAFLFAAIRGTTFNKALVSRFPYEGYYVRDYQGESYDIPTKRTTGEAVRAITDLANFIDSTPLEKTVDYIDIAHFVALDLDAMVRDDVLDKEALDACVRLVRGGRTRNIYLVAFGSEVTSGSSLGILLDHIRPLPDKEQGE